MTEIQQKSDKELINLWRHMEWILEQCVSMRDIHYQFQIEKELIARGYVGDYYPWIVKPGSLKARIAGFLHRIGVLR